MSRSAPWARGIGVVGAVVAAVALTAAPGARAAARPPAIAAREAILVEPSTGTVVYARHAQAEASIASTTKLMTALVVLEHARLGDVYRAVPYHPLPSESRIDLAPGEPMAVRDLLRALLIPSANDAAVTLAHGVAGSRAAFVALMNRRARELGLAHTHYSNPVGLDEPGNYSTAADLVRLAEVLRRHPFFDRTVDRSAARLHTGRRPRVVVSTNTTLREAPWVTGIKTGYTRQAGDVLVASGTRHGLTFLSAVLGDPGQGARDADTLALLRYGFDHYRLVRPVAAGRPVVRVSVGDRRGVTAALVPAGTLTRLVARNARVRVAIDRPRRIDGPLPRGTRVGTVDARVGNRSLGRVPLVTAAAVPGASGGSSAGIAIVAAIAAGLAIVTVGMRRRGRLGRRGRASPAARRRLR